MKISTFALSCHPCFRTVTVNSTFAIFLTLDFFLSLPREWEYAIEVWCREGSNSEAPGKQGKRLCDRWRLFGAHVAHMTHWVIVYFCLLVEV